MRAGGREAARPGLATALLLLVAACGGDGGAGPGASGAGAGTGPSGDAANGNGGAAGAAYPDADLVIVSLDTLRADALESYGGPAGISPSLLRFASEAVVFEHARAPAPETAPSHMSLFTSLHASVHGVQNLSAGEAVTALRPDALTLAEVLRAAGFETVALTDGGQLTRAPGFDRGFARFEFALEGAAAKVERGVAELQRLAAADGRHFLFWHTYETHAPYVPPRPWIEAWAPDDYHGPLRPLVEGLAGQGFVQKWEALKTSFWAGMADFGEDEARYLHGLYRGGVAHCDDELAALFEALERGGAYDDAIIVVLSDHGEEFFEHGSWQHKQLYEECLRVPLMVRLPGGEHGGRRVAVPVSLLDVAPTLVELLGVAWPTHGEVPVGGPGGAGGEGAGQRAGLLAPQGRSLAATLTGGPEPDERLLVSEFRWDAPGAPSTDWLIAQHYRGFKFIHDGYRGARQGKRLQELYDLSADPGESTDVGARHPERLAAFRERLEQFRLGVRLATEGVEAAGVEVDAATLEELRRLGYLR